MILDPKGPYNNTSQTKIRNLYLLAKNLIKFHKFLKNLIKNRMSYSLEEFPTDNVLGLDWPYTICDLKIKIIGLWLKSHLDSK